MNRRISIAIDGPAGAGKSTIAKLIAKRLNIDYIDTGAMYRALTLKVLNNNIDLDDTKSIINILNNTTIDFKDNHIFLDEKKVDDEIRQNRISQNVSYIAKIKEIRDIMVYLQRNIAINKSVIMDGRDISTHVLPNATYKFFITASVQERGIRRYRELINQGLNVDVDGVITEIKTRDNIDSTREVAPLMKTEDAIEIDTTNISIDEAVNFIIDIINKGGCR